MPFLSQYIFKRKSKRLLAALFDALGSLFFLFSRLTQRKLDPACIQKILVIRLDQLGDTAMMRPALRALRARFPHARIDLLLARETAPLFQDSREAREILVLDGSWFSDARPRDQWKNAQKILKQLQENHYDLGVDFRGDLRNIVLMHFAKIPFRFGYGVTGGRFLLTHPGDYSPREHQVMLNLKLLKPLRINPEIFNEPFSYSETRKVKFWESPGRLLPQGPKPRILIHPGAGFPSKRWSPENFRVLIESILQEDLGHVILIGTEKEKVFLPLQVGDERVIDLRGQTTLDELPILFDACHFYIGNDSGPSHIAAAQGLSLVILFSGTNDASVWHPWSKSLALVRHEVPCSPCEARECPLKHHDCMEKISPEQVLTEVRKFLSKAGAPLL